MIPMLVFACGGVSSEDPTASDITDPKPEASVTDPMAQVRDRLQDPTEAVGPVAQAFVALATTLEVGTVRCPSVGAGRVRRVYGTPRDRLDLGISYRIAQPEDPIPWSPYFDEVAVEDGWVTMLAQPGTTEGYVRAAMGVQKMVWPPAKAGESVTCTSVELLPKRAVAGSINPVEVGVVDGSCLGDPVLLGKDGTFVVEANPPCTLWILTKEGHRSAPISVPLGEEKLDIGVVELPQDPYQNADGSWTPEGRTRLTELIAIAEADIEAREKLIAGVEGSVAESALRFWKGTIYSSKRDIETIRRMLLGSK